MFTNETQNVKITNADPSALGLFGLAMVTLVASSQKLGLTEGTSFILPWAIFLGGFAQLFACINDSKRNNVFGATAFGGFAFFWMGVAATWLIKAGVFGQALASTVDPKQLGFAYVGYLIFSLFMTIGATETHKVLFTIFVLIDFLFIGLSLSTFGIMHKFSHSLAAYSELLIALVSFYGSAAAVLNAHFGKQFLPVGKPFGIFKK
ncbi:acetate uptake transporter [Clostridium tagluense]|uniref:acetate uptake transporter n=1 Tax=Clostridium tagluense TaxID=360422 RepID=UPI001CF2B271|nr:acetate uptake transporter [Clostridium tagluense]MCB2299694.1 acetate uptake transporter [Clostridium tagluense]